MTNKPPIANKIPHDVLFGKVSDENRGEKIMDPPITRKDDYYWMRSDKRDNKDVLEHLEKENQYTKQIMDKHKEQEDAMYKEIKSHIQETYDSYPYPKGECGWNSRYYYFHRTIEGKSYPIYCRKEMETGNIEVLLDVNEKAGSKTTYDLSSFRVTKNHELMSYGVDEEGNEKYKFFIQNIETGEMLEHNMPELMYCSYFWHKNHIYYEMGDDTNRMFQVWKYNFDTKENTLIYQNDNELMSVDISLSNDEKYFFVSSSSYDSGETFYFTEDDEELKLIKPMEKDVLYHVYHHHDKFILLTNKDGCKNFKLMITNIEGKSDDNIWTEFIPYDENIYIKDLTEHSDFLLIEYKEKGINKVKVLNYNNGKYDFDNVYQITLDESTCPNNIDVYNLGIYNTNKIWMTSESLNTPLTLYEFNVDTKKVSILKEKEVLNFNKDDYETEKVFAPSHDGVEVPISLVYKKSSFKKDGSNPLYLYGYGSYGYTIDPDFSSKILPLLNRGFVYAIAHVRGSSYLGYKWYEDGKMKNKMNTFKDFIGCAEYLIKENYTFSKGVTIEGRSAGGLLVGASMTMRPDLFRNVIAGVPFVDVLNTMCDPSIPLTTPEWEQWGNPNQREYYDYIKQYSPYDNIKKPLIQICCY